MLDFSDVHLEDPEHDNLVTVGRVQAECELRTGPVPIAKLLSAADRRRLADQPWLTTAGDHETRDPELLLKGRLLSLTMQMATTGDGQLKHLVDAVVRTAAAQQAQLSTQKRASSRPAARHAHR